MTPKLKAKDLYDKFYNEVGFIDPQSKAKLCALIAVDEILQTNPTIKGNSDDLITMIIQTKAYWYQVQDELDKL